MRGRLGFVMAMGLILSGLADDWPADGNVEFRLAGAVWGEDALVTLARRAGRWPETGDAYTPNAAKSDHAVRVLAMSSEPAALRLRLEVQAAPDPWNRGGVGVYELRLRAPDAGAWIGDYQGTFHGQPVTGAVLTVLSPVWPRVAAARPLAPLEHPRLAGRVSDWLTPTPTSVTAEANAAMRGILHPRSPPFQVDWCSVFMDCARDYDRYYHQADPALRIQAADALLTYARGMMYGPEGTSTPWHNWQGVYRAAAGYLALAILGDPVSRPDPPLARERVTIDSAVGVPPPPTDVPVIALPSELRPNRQPLGMAWLATEPLPGARAAPVGDLPAGPGGGAAWWRAGGTGGVGMARAPVRRLDLAALVESGLTGESEPVAFPMPLLAAPGQVRYLQGAGQVAAPAVLRFTVQGGARLWISGRAIRNDQTVILGAGWHPILVEIRHERHPTGAPVQWRVPDWREDEPPETQAARWRADVEYWERNGGAAREAADLIRLAGINCGRYLRWAIGDGGFTTESEAYTRFSVGKIAEFARAYRDGLGVEIVPGTHAARLAWRAHAAPSGARGAETGFYDGGDIRDLLSPAELAPLQYRRPAEWPDYVLYDRQKASLIARNGWRSSREDIGVILEGKGQHLRGAHTQYHAGTFRVFGFGQAWTVAGAYERDWPRANHSVVCFPRDPVNGTLPARATAFASWPDGSVAVTFNLDEPALRESGRGALVDYEGRLRPEAVEDLGIRHTRAFAVDFSGAGGTPLVLAIADRITGGGPRVWQWNYGGARARLACQVRHDGFDLGPATMNSSALPQPRLRCTFLPPMPDTIHDRNGIIQAAGHGDFLAVATLGYGTPPVPRAETGTGADTAFQVGELNVRYVEGRFDLRRGP